MRVKREFTKWAIQPAVIFTLVFFCLPLLIMVVVSFWQRIYGKLQATWSITNYVKFLGTDYLRDTLQNSLEVTLITTLASVLLAYPLAWILAYRIPPKWQKILLILIVLPFWTAYVVRSYSWLLVISEKGIINVVLLSLGIIQEPLELAYQRGATILGFVHFFTMLMTLTIYANLVQIKSSYHKAAADLGANRFQVFIYVTLPLSIPGVAVGAFITFVIAIGDYITPQILGGGTEMLAPQAIMLQVSRAANFPMAAVMSLTLMVVVIIVYLMVHKHLKMDRI